jgi:hypothetical protein
VNPNTLGGFRSTMNKREAIERYREVYRGLNSIILEWDPYGLYAVGELDDEFSDEVTSILAELQAVESESDAIQAVHRVFAKAFSEHDFSPARCAEVGRKIYAWWRAQA